MSLVASAGRRAARALPFVSLAQVVKGAGQPLALWEPQLSITRSTTPIPSGSSQPAVTFTFASGAATRAMALRVEAQSSTTFRYSADGGTNWLESGATIANGGTYACKGAATGVTINFPSGTYASGQAWDDVAASVADRGTGANTQSPTAGGGPRIRSAGGGRIYLANDSGESRGLTCSLNLPAPGITPFWIIAFVRARSAPASSMIYCGASSSSALLFHNSDLNSYAYNGTAVLGGTTQNNVWTRVCAYFSNNASDVVRYSSGRHTGNAGNTDPPAGFSLFSDNAGAFPLTGDIERVGIWSALPNNLDEIDTFARALQAGFST